MNFAAVGGGGSPGDLLAVLLGRLREPPKGFRPAGGDALSVDADRFVESLARHMRDSKETLFLELRPGEPGSASALEDLEEGHRVLHRYARDLALQIRCGDRERAYGVGRSFLAVLMDHLQRETAQRSRRRGSSGARGAG